MESSSSGDPPPRTAGPRPGEALGRYRIESEIGSGAQGAVYLAHDSRLDRKVALKVMHKLADGDTTVAVRLAREAQLAARIDDPSACEVYEFGTEGGYAFLAMRYVEGRSLDGFVRAGPDDAPLQSREVVQRLLWIEQVAEALHKAHVLGILHRDIKPGNFMVASDGRAVLLDFGIAKQTDTPDSTQTIDGLVSGTPSYMSPEQLMLDGPALDGRSDVYSLGVTLYELIARRSAFGGGNELFPTLASRQKLPDLEPVVAAWGKDLQAVLERALAVDRAERYDSAKAFADDVRRCRQRLPVAARPASAWLRLRRWSSRNRALAATTFGLAVSLVVGAALSLSFAWRAVQAKEQSEWSRYVGDLVLASKHVADGKPQAAVARLQGSPETLRDYEWAQLSAQTDDTLDEVAVCDAPLRRIRAAGADRVVVIDRNRRKHLLSNGHVIEVVQPEGFAGGVELAGDVSDGLRVHAVEDMESVRLQVAIGDEAFEVPCPTIPHAIWIAPDDSGALLYGAERVHALSVRERRVYGPVELRLSQQAFVEAPDGLRVVAVQNDGTYVSMASVLSWPELRREDELLLPPGVCSAVAVSKDGARVFFAMRDLFVARTARVLAYDHALQGPIGRYEGAMGEVEAIVVSPNDDWIALGESSGLLRILDGGLTSELRQVVGHRGEFAALAALDAQRVATGNELGVMRTFEVMPAPRSAMVRPPIGERLRLHFDAPTGRLWASTAIGARGYDLVAGGPPVEILGNSSAIGTHGARVWTHSYMSGAPVVERDLDSGAARDVIRLPDRWVRAAVLLPEDRRALLAVFRDGHGDNELLDVAVVDGSGRLDVRSLGLLPAGRPVLSLNRTRDALAVAAGNRVVVWDLRGGTEQAHCETAEPVDVLAWLDEDRLVMTGEGAQLTIRDRALREVGSIALPAACVDVEVHPSAARLIVVDATGAVGVCSLDPLEYLVTLPRVAGARRVALDGDARWLVTASADGTVEVLGAPRAAAALPATAVGPSSGQDLTDRFARRLIARSRMFGYARKAGGGLPDMASLRYLPRLFYEVLAETLQVDAFGYDLERMAMHRALSLTWIGRHDEARALLRRLIDKVQPFTAGALRELNALVLLESMAGNGEAAAQAFTALVHDCFDDERDKAEDRCGDAVIAVEHPQGGRALRWLCDNCDDEQPVPQLAAILEQEDAPLADAVMGLWRPAKGPGPFWLFTWLVVSEPDLDAKHYRAALRWERRAATISPTAALPELRAAAFVRLGEPKQALAILDAMPAVDPFRMVVRSWFTALACAASGDLERARRVYNELVLQLNARQLRDCERRDEIREEVRRAVYR